MKNFTRCCPDFDDHPRPKDLECIDTCHDHHEYIILRLVIPILIVGLLLVLIILIIGTSCWCYHKRRRSREMAILTEEGELVVVKDDRKHTERREPLVIRLSQLESRRV